MKQPEMIEGAEAFTRFQTAMKKIISVPNSVVKQRIEEHKRQAALSPNKRGPKKKAKAL